MKLNICQSQSNKWRRAEFKSPLQKYAMQTNLHILNGAMLNHLKSQDVLSINRKGNGNVIK
jgi:hypothetical protein